MNTRRPARADRAGLVELYALLQAALAGLQEAGAAPVFDSGPAGDPGGSPAPGTQASLGTWLLQATHSQTAKPRTSGGAHVAAITRAGAQQDVDDAADETQTRVVALVELAKKGDAEAFGQLYDNYVSTIYRYIYYRVGGHALAEDLTSETFLRALRSLTSFRWQGRDFGAWLVTIARNLVADHFKSGRFRLEVATGEILDYDSAADGPEDDVLAMLTNEALVTALKKLGTDQQECLVLRFLNGLSVTETARVLGKSDGAIKQLQLRAIRNLAKLLPDGFR
jgi:RNA polymerase sigma-70 factor, ECF subfamily